MLSCSLGLRRLRAGVARKEKAARWRGWSFSGGNRFEDPENMARLNGGGCGVERGGGESAAWLSTKCLGWAFWLGAQWRSHVAGGRFERSSIAGKRRSRLRGEVAQWYRSRERAELSFSVLIFRNAALRSDRASRGALSSHSGEGLFGRSNMAAVKRRSASPPPRGWLLSRTLRNNSHE